MQAMQAMQAEADGGTMHDVFYREEPYVWGRSGRSAAPAPSPRGHTPAWPCSCAALHGSHRASGVALPQLDEHITHVESAERVWPYPRKRCSCRRR